MSIKIVLKVMLAAMCVIMMTGAMAFADDDDDVEPDPIPIPAPGNAIIFFEWAEPNVPVTLPPDPEEVPIGSIYEITNGYIADQSMIAPDGDKWYYLFKGWDKNHFKVTGDTVIKGTWSIEDTVPVEYSFINDCPPEDEYPCPKNEAAPYREDYEIKGPKKGDTYSNKYGTWTFQGWYEGVDFIKNYTIKNLEDAMYFEGEWEFEPNYCNVTFKWSNKEDIIQKIELPKDDIAEYGLSYVVDADMTEKYLDMEIETKGGVWTFEGWDNEEVDNVTGDIVITGTWEFEAEDEEPLDKDDGVLYDDSELRNKDQLKKSSTAGPKTGDSAAQEMPFYIGLLSFALMMLGIAVKIRMMKSAK